MPSYKGVRKKGDKWYFRINHHRKDGKRYQEEHGGYDSAQEAYNARNEYLSQVNKPKTQPNGTTIGEFVVQYIAQKTCKESTLRQYMWLSECVREMIGDRKLCEFKTRDVSNFCTEFGKTPQKKRKDRTNSAQSVVHMRNFLSGMFEYAISEELIQVNPVTRYHAPEPERTAPNFWTPEELHQFLSEVAKSRHAIAFELMAGSGCRIGEIVALRWRQVNFDTGKIRITTSRTHGLKGYKEGAPKKGSFRSITLPTRTLDALRIHKLNQDKERAKAGGLWEDNDLVVATELGRPVSPSNLRTYMSRVVKRLGLPPLSPHGLRHTHATLLLAEQKPLNAVAERLGHKDPSVTARTYAHVLASTEQDLATTMNNLLST
ncbi:MAG: site-specific integrase [Alicyclobacillus sp.]|nr:site-specific integrase [Alicyclobacillus sp.]